MREGKKITPAEQLAPAANVAPQVVCDTLKGAAVVSASEVAAELPLLVSVTVCAALEEPGATMGKINCEGLTLIPVKDCPVPVRGTVTDATPEVDEETTSEAIAPPASAGVKITRTVQLAPLASVAPQVVVPVEKLEAETPVIWKPTLAIDAPPVLLTVSVCGELAAPTVCPVKVRLAGLTLMIAGLRPVPLSATVCVSSASLMVKVPVWAPAAVGTNRTLIAQLERAPKLAVQAFVC